MKHLGCQRTLLIYRKVVATLTPIKMNGTCPINTKGDFHVITISYFPQLQLFTQQNKKWNMTIVSLSPSLEAGLGKVVEFWTESLATVPNSCSSRGWVGSEPLAMNLAQCHSSLVQWLDIKPQVRQECREWLEFSLVLFKPNHIISFFFSLCISRVKDYFFSASKIFGFGPD